MWSKTFFPWGKVESSVFPPDCMALCLERSLWQDYVPTFPTHFVVGNFSTTQHAGVSQLVAEFLTDEIDPCVYSVCPY